MRRQEEVELKWALTPDEHARLAQALAARFGPPHDLDQRNRFFDAADGRLRRAGLSVRVRRENARIVLTCKMKVGDRAADDALFRHGEWERDLDPPLWAAAEAAPPGLADALALPEAHKRALDGAELVALGGFDNHRLEWHAPDVGELICLDRTTFSDGVDHELEIETTDPVATAARWGRWFATLGIPLRPQPTTKFARFLARRAGTR
ncbi:MAG TPA: CYTH domain-containing protein [Planctomycetota bacterium]|nr:CYTH domain-containing protein [Planctomycetota bacterium]